MAKPKAAAVKKLSELTRKQAEERLSLSAPRKRTRRKAVRARHVEALPPPPPLPTAYEPMHRKVASALTVREYIAVDANGHYVAGPFLTYSEAKQHADRAAGLVKFVAER